MDPDVGQVRAFVAAADHGNFGRAAAALSLTQQGLSRRIAALEERHGRLFRRESQGVTLTARGEALLPAARTLLEAADRLSVADGSAAETLVVDVWSPGTLPQELLSGFVVASTAAVEFSRRGNFSAAVDALARRELDAVYGWVAGLSQALPDGLTHRLAGLMRAGALVDAEGPLADVDVIDRALLRDTGLVVVQRASSPEIERFVQDFAADMGTTVVDATRPVDMGLIIPRIGFDTATLVPATLEPPAGTGVLAKPVSPTPLYPYDLVWRADDDREGIQALVAHTEEHAPDPAAAEGDVWLPPPLRGG